MTDQTNPTTEPPKGRPRKPDSLRGLLDGAIDELEAHRNDASEGSLTVVAILLTKARKKVR